MLRFVSAEPLDSLIVRPYLRRRRGLPGANYSALFIGGWMRTPVHERNPGRCFSLAGLAVAAAYWVTFSRFYPTALGTLGADFSLFLPMLLDGTWWVQQNGWSEVPWFSPSWCGGVPSFANPESLHYSVPQILSVCTDPVRAVWLTHFVFGVLGAVGVYRLMRDVFSGSSSAGFVGAVLFLFNGFFSHRMLIGHLSFHGYMLTPLIAWCLLSRSRGWGLGRAFGASIATAYLVFSGMVNVLLPTALALVLIALLFCTMFQAGLRRGPAAEGWPWQRWLVALMLAVGLAASKLVAVFSYVRLFPRDQYPLPGFDSVMSALVVLVRGMFWRVPEEFFSTHLVNSPFILERHEIEMGMSPVPIILFAAVLVFWVVSPSDRPQVGPGRRMRLVILLAFSLVPVVLNIYQSSWNALLKQLPLIGSSSSMLRMFSAYLPLVAVLGGLSLDRLPGVRKMPVSSALLITFVVVAFQVTVDRGYYTEQPYRGELVTEAHRRSVEETAAPPIRNLAYALNGEGQIVEPLNRNDMLVIGSSQILCRQPIFGYRLESFPSNELRAGDVFGIRGEKLNLNDPSCFLFPEENDCQPGAAFPSSELIRAQSFAARQPFSFEMSRLQRSANWISLVALSVLLTGGLLLLCLCLRRVSGTST